MPVRRKRTARHCTLLYSTYSTTRQYGSARHGTVHHRTSRHRVAPHGTHSTHGTARHARVQHGTCAARHGTSLRGQHRTAWHDMAPRCGTPLHDMALHSTTQHVITRGGACAVWNGITQHCMAQTWRRGADSTAHTTQHVSTRACERHETIQQSMRQHGTTPACAAQHARHARHAWHSTARHGTHGTVLHGIT